VAPEHLSGKEVRLLAGSEEVMIRSSEFLDLLKGRELSAELDNKLRTLFTGRRTIFIRDALTRAAGGELLERMADEGRAPHSPLRLVVELQRRYPNGRFFLDDPEAMGPAKERAASLPDASGLANVALVYDRGAFADRGVLDDIQAYL